MPTSNETTITMISGVALLPKIQLTSTCLTLSTANSVVKTASKTSAPVRAVSRRLRFWTCVWPESDIASLMLPARPGRQLVLHPRAAGRKLGDTHGSSHVQGHPVAKEVVQALRLSFGELARQRHELGRAAAYAHSHQLVVAGRVSLMLKH